MMSCSSKNSTDVFKDYLKTTGFLSGKALSESDLWMKKYPGIIHLDESFVSESGGMLLAVSRKAANIIRKDLRPLVIRDPAAEYKQQWQYILMHKYPHLDEYLSSLMLRSCIPDDMHGLIQDEIALLSASDDADAKKRWPHAVLLGIGNTANGGAQPMLLLDEHESPGKEKKHSSLVMLTKRYLLGGRQAPPAFYKMIRETNFIDQYGDIYPKDISAYAKHLQTVPLLSANGQYMFPEWKCAVMDGCLTAFYIGLQAPKPWYMDRRVWESTLRLSFEDFAYRTPLRSEPRFSSVYNKILKYLTDRFARAMDRGETKYTIPAENGKASVETELHMLVSYLPALCFRLWGAGLGQMLLYPLWECRVYREMMTERCYSELCKIIPAGAVSVEPTETNIGRISVNNCLISDDPEHPIRIIDFAPINGNNSPASLNQFIKNNAGGYGFAIFRNRLTGTIALTKGDKIDREMWERICNRLIEEEGQTEDPDNPGAWHVTRNPNGYAPFLLNGNATHRYVPRSHITAASLARIVDEFLLERVCQT